MGRESAALCCGFFVYPGFFVLTLNPLYASKEVAIHRYAGYYESNLRIKNFLLFMSKSINRKGRKGFTQRTQRGARLERWRFNFAYFAPTLRALRLKWTFQQPHEVSM